MIDVIDTAFLAQNDAGGMAVFNELALAMAGGGEGALESALRGHAADRGDDLTLGQLLRDALHGGASLGSMATLDVLGGLRAVDSGGGGGELATLLCSRMASNFHKSLGLFITIPSNGMGDITRQ